MVKIVEAKMQDRLTPSHKLRTNSNTILTDKRAGPEIATSESPMRLKIKLWRPKFLNWSPVGDLPFSLEDFTLLKKIFKEKLVQVGQYSDIREFRSPIGQSAMFIVPQLRGRGIYFMLCVI